MNKNIEDYVFHKRNFLDSQFCKDGIISLEEGVWDKHTWKIYDGQSLSSVSSSKQMEPSYKAEGEDSSNFTVNVTSLNHFILEKLHNAIKEYFVHLGFDWFHSWLGYSSIKFIKYSLGEEMMDHYDCIHSLFDGERRGIPTLSIIGTLNDDYEGGELYMFIDKKIDMKAGDLLIFPSTFMYPHRVDPVKNGTRYSYVSWTW